MPTKTDSKDVIAAAAAKKAAAAAKKAAAATKKAQAAEKAAAKIAAAKEKAADAKAAAKLKAKEAKDAAKAKAKEAKAAAKAAAGPVKPKAGPPFTYAMSGQVENPISKTLRSQGVEVILLTGERAGTWFWGHSVIIPANGKAKAETLGTAGVFATDGNVGYSIKEGALFEAAKDALQTILKAGKKVPKEVAPDMEAAIEKLKPAAIKQAEKSHALVEYDPSKAGGYLSAFNKYGEAHHSGVIFKPGMDVEAFKEFGGALEHIDQKSKWMRADWYIHGVKHFPKIIDTLLNTAAVQTLQNEGTIARVFPHDERREGLTFSHHAEVAGIKSKAERNKWLDKAADEGLSVAKLRKAIADSKAGVAALTAPLTTGEGTPGGKDGGAGTPADPALAGAGTVGSAGTAPSAGAAGAAGAAGSGTPAGGDGSQGTAPGDDYSAPAEEEKTPAEKAEAELDAVVEKLDAVESIIRGGLLSNTLAKPSRVKEVRQMIAKLYELANGGK